MAAIVGDIGKKNFSLPGCWVTNEQIAVQQKSHPPYMLGADWVKAPDVPETFLLTAYPLDGLEEYWNGVLVDGVTIGVQLASAFEGDYHMAKVGVKKEFSNGWIRLDKQTVCEGVVERTYKVYSYRESLERDFYHYELNNWGDNKTPEPVVFETLMRLYESQVSVCLEMAEKKVAEGSSAPLISQVHCMGGVGRTGTFVFTRVLKCQKSQDKAYEVIGHLREQRSGLVETQEQFDFAIAHSKDDRSF